MKEKIKETIIGFYDEMKIWELESYPKIKQAVLNVEFAYLRDEVRSSLRLVIEKYCQINIEKAERVLALNCGVPVEYDFANSVLESIEFSEKNASAVIQHNYGFGFKNKYSLKLFDENWKLVSKHYFSVTKGDWKKSYF